MSDRYIKMKQLNNGAWDDVYPETVVTQVSGLTSQLAGKMGLAVTAAPTSATTVPQIVILNSEPATKYDGWIYIITEA